jgi:hypothetical protein
MLFRSPRMYAPRLTVMFIGLLLCVGAEARPKEDTLILDNGDIIQGEIKSMDNALLRYSTTAMGTVSVEWDHVQSLESNYLYRVRVIGGRRYFGALVDPAPGGEIRLAHAGGIEEIPVQDVVAIMPIDTTFEDRLDTMLSVGYADFKASDSSTASFGMNMTYFDELSKNTLDARSIVTDNANETNTSSRVDFSRQRLREDPRYFNHTGASWETNDELAIDYRVALSLGLGKNLIDSNKMKLAVTGGLQGLTEKDSVGETTESLEGLIILRLSSWRFDTPELDLTTTISIYPGITEAGRYRSDGDISLKWEVLEDFNLSISAFGNFDSESSDEGDDYDYGIITGIEWEL